MNLTGQIKAIMPIKETATFKSVEVIITTDLDTMYPQYVSCQLTRGKTSLIDGIKVGDLVTAEFNLRGREWLDPNTKITKYFNSIEIWQLKKQ